MPNLETLREIRAKLQNAQTKLLEWQKEIDMMKKAGLPTTRQEQDLAAYRAQIERLRSVYG